MSSSEPHDEDSNLEIEMPHPRLYSMGSPEDPKYSVLPASLGGPSLFTQSQIQAHPSLSELVGWTSSASQEWKPHLPGINNTRVTLQILKAHRKHLETVRTVLAGLSTDYQACLEAESRSDDRKQSLFDVTTHLRWHLLDVVDSAGTWMFCHRRYNLQQRDTSSGAKEPSEVDYALGQAVAAEWLSLDRMGMESAGIDYVEEIAPDFTSGLESAGPKHTIFDNGHFYTERQIPFPPEGLKSVQTRPEEPPTFISSQVLSGISNIRKLQDAMARYIVGVSGNLAVDKLSRASSKWDEPAQADGWNSGYTGVTLAAPTATTTISRAERPVLHGPRSPTSHALPPNGTISSLTLSLNPDGDEKAFNPSTSTNPAKTPLTFALSTSKPSQITAQKNRAKDKGAPRFRRVPFAERAAASLLRSRLPPPGSVSNQGSELPTTEGMLIPHTMQPGSQSIVSARGKGKPPRNRRSPLTSASTTPRTSHNKSAASLPPLSDLLPKDRPEQPDMRSASTLIDAKTPDPTIAWGKFATRGDSTNLSNVGGKRSPLLSEGANEDETPLQTDKQSAPPRSHVPSSVVGDRPRIIDTSTAPKGPQKPAVNFSKSSDGHPDPHVAMIKVPTSLSTTIGPPSTSQQARLCATSDDSSIPLGHPGGHAYARDPYGKLTIQEILSKLSILEEQKARVYSEWVHSIAAGQPSENVVSPWGVNVDWRNPPTQGLELDPSKHFIAPGANAFSLRSHRFNPEAIPFGSDTSSATLPGQSHHEPYFVSDATHPHLESLKILPPHLARRRNSWDGTLSGTQLGGDDDDNASDTSRPPSV